MLSIDHLTKHFGALCVVKGVTFEVGRGEMAALLGPAGSGKSMVLRLVAGLETPSSGDLVLAGESLIGVPARRRGVGYVNQNHFLFDHMTVSENIAFDLKAVRTCGSRIHERVMELLDQLGLSGLEGHFPVELTPEQRRRVALGRALAASFRLLVLDEPFAGLTDVERRRLAGLLRQVNSRTDVTILCGTQHQDEAMRTR